MGEDGVIKQWRRRVMKGQRKMARRQRHGEKASSIAASKNAYRVRNAGGGSEKSEKRQRNGRRNGEITAAAHNG